MSCLKGSAPKPGDPPHHAPKPKPRVPGTPLESYPDKNLFPKPSTLPATGIRPQLHRGRVTRQHGGRDILGVLRLFRLPLRGIRNSLRMTVLDDVLFPREHFSASCKIVPCYKPLLKRAIVSEFCKM